MAEIYGLYIGARDPNDPYVRPGWWFLQVMSWEANLIPWKSKIRHLILFFAW